MQHHTVKILLGKYIKGRCSKKHGMKGKYSNKAHVAYLKFVGHGYIIPLISSILIFFCVTLGVSYINTICSIL